MARKSRKSPESIKEAYMDMTDEPDPLKRFLLRYITIPLAAVGFFSNFCSSATHTFGKIEREFSHRPYTVERVGDELASDLKLYRMEHGHRVYLGEARRPFFSGKFDYTCTHHNNAAEQKIRELGGRIHDDEHKAGKRYHLEDDSAPNNQPPHGKRAPQVREYVMIMLGFLALGVFWSYL